MVFDTSNQRIFDQAVSHYIQTRRFEATLTKEQDAVFKKHSSELKRTFLANPRSSLKSLYSNLNKKLQSVGVVSTNSFLSDEIDFHRNLLHSQTGNFFNVKTPSKSAASKAFLNKNIFSLASMSSEYRKIATSSLNAAESVIRRGLAEGMSQQEILDNLQKTVNVSGNQARALLRTGVTQAETDALRSVVEANPELIQGLEYVAILDSRTSSVCSTLNGTVFQVDDTANLPPRHVNCRSSVVPVLKSQEELLNTDSPRIKKRKLSRVPAERLTGDLSAKEDFSEWLKRQPFKEKLNHLGSEERVSLFDSGALEVKDFFTSAGKPLPLKDLKLESSRRTFGLFQKKRAPDEDLLIVKNSRQLLNNPLLTQRLRQLYIDDATNASQFLSITDYKGVTVSGKRAVRRRAHNVFDERNSFSDPLTGESANSLYYDPDFQVYQERVDFLQNSKLLTAEQKDYIQRTADSLEDKVSRNQQTAVLENLRVVLERHNKNPSEPWGNFASVLRNEMQYSVTNTSRILDRRSRTRGQLFDTNTDGTGSVYVLGDRYTFDELVSRYRTDLKYQDEWVDTVGLTFAEEAYLAGRSPMRLYLEKFNPLPAETVARALDKINPITQGKKAFNALLREPRKLLATINDVIDRYYLRNKEGFFREAIRNKQEDLARLLDYEFSVGQGLVRPTYNKVLNTLARDKKAVRSLSKAYHLVATGRATDYDSLAIKIGQNFIEDFKLEYPFFSSSLQDAHKLGSEFLQGMVKAGHIRVDTRGVTRRAIVDIDTGRPSSAYKDTVSREVSVVSPELLELQKASRRLVFVNRIGITGPENDLRPRRGSLAMYDSTGRKTSQSIVTTSASKHFDPRNVDADVVDFVRKGMEFEYVTDPEFATFFERVLRFRDPRGNTEKWDELNKFRQIILQRGEQGEGMMQTLRWHNQRGKPWRARAQIDGRGRLYFNGFLTPTGGEFVRPFLNTAVAKNVTPEGVDELITHLGALLGEGTEALTQKGRRDIFKRNEEDLLSLAEIMVARTQPDRRIRDFLEHPLVRELDGEELPQVARFALEYKRFHDHTGGDVYNPEKLVGLKTQLGSEVDASASAVQIISLATGNKNLATISNVIPTKAKNRVYDLVAQDVKSDLRYLEIEDRLGIDLEWTELAKGAKAAVMLSGYGSGRAGIAAAVSDKLQGLLKKKGFVVTTKAELNAELRNIRRLRNNARINNLPAAEAALEQLEKDILLVVSNESNVVKQAADIAADYSPDTARFLERFQGPASGNVSPDDFVQISNLMLESLESRAPGMEGYINWAKDAAVTFMKDTGSTSIPFRTFDQKTWQLRFRPEIEEEIRFFDPVSRRYIRNIVKSTVEDDKLVGLSSVVKSRTSYGVSSTHGRDASVLRIMYKLADRDGVNLTSIHDAVFASIEDMAKIKEYANRAYAIARDADTMRNSLLDMRRQGLSKKEYDRLLELGERNGLFLDQYTGDDILQEPKKGYDRYGWLA